MSEQVEARPDEAGKELGYADISPAGRVGLLDVAFSRVNYGFGAMVVVSLPFIAWYIYLGQNPLGLVLWAAWYFVGMLVVRWQYRRYHRERAEGEPTSLVAANSWNGAGLRQQHGRPAVTDGASRNFRIPVTLLGDGCSHRRWQFRPFITRVIGIPQLFPDRLGKRDAAGAL